MWLFSEGIHGQLDQGFVVEGFEDRSHGLHGDDEAGDCAGGDDPAVGDGHGRAGGDGTHDGGSGEDLVVWDLLG